ncbi:ribosomal protein L44, mitochondrial [Trichonephila clavata]|uniref:Large ribosomal subunit protein mL44 n=1 Tax=Trichonephila clavata TaxID=2740835 RepID=A0A8X6GKT3_TRICU|nr:ribosomal protein L44, mitochondrial [Trichonephila clavata]
MAFCKFLNYGKVLLPVKKVLGSKETIMGSGYFLTNERFYRNNYSRVLKIMKCRRSIIGPERTRRRNEFDNWNYKAELFAFSQRLSENISEETLRLAFLHDSFIQKEEQKRKELDMPSEDIQLTAKSNTSLIELGDDLTSKYVKRYLSHCFSKLPYEGICALHDYLMSDEVLSHVSLNIGTSDLIFCAEYPPENSTLAASLKAIIGSIVTESGVPRAENFVLDFICPQLIGKDVFEIWDLENPLDVLNEILLRHDLKECEPRLIFESGRNSIEAIYHVGLYSNREYLGRGPGETIHIAVEMAAYNVLRKFFGIHDSERPLYFGDKARSMDLSSYKKPPSLNEWSTKYLLDNLKT